MRSLSLPPLPDDMADFLAADDEEDPVDDETVEAAAERRSWPASGMMETEGLISACGPRAALDEESLFILVSWNSCLIGSRRTEDSLGAAVEEEETEEEAEEEDVAEEVLAVDFRLGLPASGFNAVSRGPYSFKEAVFVWKRAKRYRLH